MVDHCFTETRGNGAKMIKGGCFCGAIRYEIDDVDYTVLNCHCSMCRRASGAPYVTWIVARVENFHLTKGEPAVLESSKKGSRGFCNLCGTPVTCVNTSHPDIIDVTLCSLDDPSAMKPTREFHADARLDWVSDLSGLATN